MNRQDTPVRINRRQLRKSLGPRTGRRKNTKSLLALRQGFRVERPRARLAALVREEEARLAAASA